MELALTIEDLDPLPKQHGDFIAKPSGFLNSKYKSVVNESLNNASSKSIFELNIVIKNFLKPTIPEAHAIGGALPVSFWPWGQKPKFYILPQFYRLLRK